MIKLKSLVEEFERKDEVNKLVRALEHHLESEFPQLEDLDLYAKQEDVIYVGSIRVKKEFRGQGIGSKVMMKIIEFADKNKLIIVLHPEPEPRYKEKLLRFYSNLGFVKNKGRHMDYRLSEPFGLTMVRRPR